MPKYLAFGVDVGAEMSGTSGGLPGCGLVGFFFFKSWLREDGQWINVRTGREMGARSKG